MTNKSKALILLSMVALAAILGSVYFTVYADDAGDDATIASAPMCGGRHGGMRGGGPFGSIEVSEEYKAKVISIAESDSDVQALIAEGYNVTGVRPIIKYVVDANGDVTMKATTAIVELENGTTGHASVTVNLTQSKVTQIVILTRTVIEK
jgi:hypothetical protein